MSSSDLLLQVGVTSQIEQDAEVLTQRMRANMLYKLEKLSLKLGRGGLEKWDNPSQVKVPTKSEAFCLCLPTRVAHAVFKILFWCWWGDDSWRATLLIQAKNHIQKNEAERAEKESQKSIIMEVVRKALGQARTT